MSHFISVGCFAWNTRRTSVTLFAWEDWDVLTKVLLGVAIVLAVLSGIIALQPAEFRVVRSASIATPPERVFAAVNNFHQWRAWSPWEELDPNMKRTFDGPAAGTGSKYGWAGNDDVGEGGMTILESKPNELIRIRLEFIKPFASEATTEFVFKPEGGGTRVDWIMSGNNGFISKAFCLFMGGMDRMVGPDFEKGLAKMKSVAEAGR